MPSLTSDYTVEEGERLVRAASDPNDPIHAEALRIVGPGEGREWVYRLVKQMQKLIRASHS